MVVEFYVKPYHENAAGISKASTLNNQFVEWQINAI